MTVEQVIAIVIGCGVLVLLAAIKIFQFISMGQIMKNIDDLFKD